MGTDRWMDRISWVMIALLSLLGSVDAGEGSPSGTIREKGLLGYWRFEEGQGEEVHDSSGHGNDGDLYGAEWVKGRFGSALHFGGRDAYVSLPAIEGLDGSNEMTVEAWVYWEGGGRYPNLLTGGTWNPGGFLLFVADQECSFRLGKPGEAPWTAKDWAEMGIPLVQFSLGRWYHLAATFQRPTVRTFVNGEPVATATWDAPIGHSGEVQIGTWGNPQVCHRGLMDEVKIYNRALTPEEIRASFQKEAIGRMDLQPGEKPYEKAPVSEKPVKPAVTLETRFLRLLLDDRARVVGLIDRASGQNYRDKSLPLALLKKGGRTYKPSSCAYRKGQLTLEFGSAGVRVVLDVGLRKTYLTFAVHSVSSPEVEGLTFLNLRVKPSKYVGSMAILAADEDFAFSLRPLNLQTEVGVGGSPPVFHATGSPQYGLVGAGAALVGCPTSQLRSILKEVVKQEGLPYSALGGPFALDAEENRGSYLFALVTEKDVDEWIELARRGGFTAIHFCPWWHTLGHYEPHPDWYPRGLEGLKEVVAKIHAAGLKAGMHTLTGCISVNDPWVTPVPDPRLAKDLTFTLAAPVGPDDTTILTLERPTNLETFWSDMSTGNTLQIDDEIVAYAGILQQPLQLRSGQAYGFTGCTRGHWGTKAAAHEQGTPVHHLVASYSSYIPDENTTLVDELAGRIAHVFNTCGFDMIYMDGAEGMRSWHAIARMRRAIFERLKKPVLVEASCWDAPSWPFHSRIGAWDHPVWGFNRFTDLHCAELQRYRTHELLPGQMGWWVITGPSADYAGMFPEEMEYFCSKCLGWDAPMSLQGVATGPHPPNARQQEYLTMLGRYERLRLARYFPESVRAKLRVPRDEFRLVQADTGEWQLIPTDYARHKITSPPLEGGESRGGDSSSTWTLHNRFGPQPLKLRIEALYSCAPYDSPEGVVVADLSKPEEFTVRRAAGDITHSAGPSESGRMGERESGRVGERESGRVGERRSGRGEGPSGYYAAKSNMPARRGAWTQLGKVFSPPLDLGQCGALGVWIYGDGQGELLNFQLNNSREYYPAWDDHYVDVDFQGWRYFELLLRERDAQRHQDYLWPYGGPCEVGRTPLLRGQVGAFNLYYNELPPGEEVKCYFSPIKALPVVKVKLTNPAVTIGGHRLVFPVTLESGQYLEFEPPAGCTLYDERGAVLQHLMPEGEVPVVAAGENQVTFTCEGPKGYNARANVTIITQGKPLRGVTPPAPPSEGGERGGVDWRWLRTEYDDPRIIQALDGRQNEWDVLCRPDPPTPPLQKGGSRGARLQVEIVVDRVGSAADRYNAADALTVESFDDLSRFADSPDNRFAQYVWDSEDRGVPTKPGVTQSLERSAEVVKVGRFSACYRATSARSDSNGWSARGERFQPPLDLSRYTALGFWIHGDGGGEILKLQLRDTAGAWQDLVTKVDFTGWKYVEFELGAGAQIDLTRIEYLILYYNGIPAGKTVTCYVDDLRALGEPGAIRHPTLALAGRKVVFPVSLSAGERLVYQGPRDGLLYAREGTLKQHVQPIGGLPPLQPGRNRIVFGLGAGSPGDFQVRVLTTKVYW